RAFPLRPRHLPRGLRLRSVGGRVRLQLRAADSYPFCSPDRPATALYTLSLHDALPICWPRGLRGLWVEGRLRHELLSPLPGQDRSEEHTSELQSRVDLVCRLLLEKKTTVTAAAAPTEVVTLQRQSAELDVLAAALRSAE